jgi:hypothetical protein
MDRRHESPRAMKRTGSSHPWASLSKASVLPWWLVVHRKSGEAWSRLEPEPAVQSLVWWVLPSHPASGSCQKQE